jgi:hypothetical protein
MTKSWVLILSLMAMVASFGGLADSKKVKQATMILSCMSSFFNSSEVKKTPQIPLSQLWCDPYWQLQTAPSTMATEVKLGTSHRPSVAELSALEEKIGYNISL